MKTPIVSRYLSARERQKLFLRSIKLLPALTRRGVAPYDAFAVAFNASFLFYNMPRSVFLLSPKAILRKYSYSEIASLCENILGIAEFAINKNFNSDEHAANKCDVNKHERQFMYSSTPSRSDGQFTRSSTLLRNKEALP